MNGSARSPEMQKIQAMAAQLAEQGYEVVIEPTAERLPFSLGQYRPDLIAFKDEGGIVLEVRQSHRRLSVDRFQEIAEQIAAHEGWRFLLVTLDDAIAGNRGDEAKLPVDSKRFWQGRSLAEQLAEHPVEPVVSLEQLKSKAWPEDELIEDFLEFTRAQRHEALAEEQP